MLSELLYKFDKKKRGVVLRTLQDYIDDRSWDCCQ